MYVPDHTRKCVAFLGIKERGRFVPKATGFFINFNENSLSYPYIVTAEHVISGLLLLAHDIWVRINTSGGGVCESNFGREGWVYHPGSPEEQSDVAVCMAAVDSSEDVLHVGLGGKNSFLLSDEQNKHVEFGVGDEVAIVGLFRSHFGKEKNIPIVRIGNIAAMSEEPVHTTYCGYTTACLIEARSINGLSGSPVFINLPPIHIEKGSIQVKTSRMYLFGLMHGHFDVENTHEDIVIDDVGGQSLGVNTGIGVVIPTSKIIETLMQDEQVEFRRKLAANMETQDENISD